MIGQDDHVFTIPEERRIVTTRLNLRPWTLDDAEAALAIYGSDDVARWLSPAMDRVSDVAAMRQILRGWIGVNDRIGMPLGRWAITDAESGAVLGGVALLPLPPGDADIEIGWQLAPEAWGRGVGAEAGHAVAHQAFENGSLTEVFAVVRPGNKRGVSTARRVGMEWVGETDKYYGLRLQVYRLTKADLDHAEPGD